MNRNDFLFKSSSRIYHQSASTSATLLDELKRDNQPFRETLSILKKNNKSILCEAPDIESAAILAWKNLVEIGSTLNMRSVIPALLEMAEQYYYGNNGFPENIPWLGSAIKTSTAIVWKNRNSISSNGKSINQMRRLVSAAGAWEQLILHYDQSRAFNLGTMEFFADGIYLENKDLDFREKWNEFTFKRGLSLRTLKNCSNVIWKSPLKFLEASAEVANGERPSSIPMLQGTIFEEIDSCPEFWLGLFARIQLFIVTSRIRSLGFPKKNNGVSLFEPFAICSSLLRHDKYEVTSAVRSMFWQPDWFDKRISNRDWISNMLIERPAIRIDEKTFVTATIHIGDSINWFVESSIFRQTGYGGVPVPEEAFRCHVSQPFEKQTIACFLEERWKVDHVSEKGIWAGAKLDHKSDIESPGEIDVLALHPSGRVAVLCECKVLVAPLNSNKLLNLSKKLGSADSEGFHSKLNKKAAWLGETKQFENIEIIKLIVVDRGSFMSKGADNIVIDIELLPSIIDCINANF